MIGYIEGKILSTTKDALLVNVGGVGYIVHVSSSLLTRATPNSTIGLFTHLAVREDALDLYGFEAQGEVSLFQQFISISGIGPKSGLSIMNLADEHTLRTAISAGDTAYLTRVSGIGKKIAEKVVLELKDKMVVTGDSSPLVREDSDVLQALEALGYGKNEAREALKLITKDAKGTNERLKEALKILGRG